MGVLLPCVLGDGRGTTLSEVLSVPEVRGAGRTFLEPDREAVAVTEPRVAVVGGGVTGLLAAAHLADADAEVTVLEASDRVGGQLCTGLVGGQPVDLGAEALHLGAPGVAELIERAGLTADLVDARPGPTMVATRRGLRQLPGGMGPSGPSRLWPVATSRILSLRGLVRAAAEPAVRSSDLDGDVAVGEYLARRFGRELVDRLLDPLLGNLHAGDVDRLSLAAATPQLDRLARQHRSLVLARRGGGRAAPPRFATVVGGLSRIATALAADPRIVVRTSTPVQAVRRTAAGYLVDVGVPLEVDAVVFALPARSCATLLEPLAPRAAEPLRELRANSVATVAAAYPRGALRGLPAADANGILVPRSLGRPLNAATLLTNKWPHLDDGGSFLVRLSVADDAERPLGQRSDAQVLDLAHAGFARITGIASPPLDATVQRWQRGMPQLEVGHRDRLGEARRQLEGEALVLAGASCDGVGIINCIRSAEASAARTLEQLERRRVAA